MSRDRLMAMETTPGQRQAVRRDECRVHGHRFSEVLKLGTLAPQSVICDNCGATWRIHPDDQERNFGQGEAHGE